jgi:hypothetical protein
MAYSSFLEFSNVNWLGPCKDRQADRSLLGSDEIDRQHEDNLASNPDDAITLDQIKMTEKPRKDLVHENKLSDSIIGLFPKMAESDTTDRYDSSFVTTKFNEEFKQKEHLKFIADLKKGVEMLTDKHYIERLAFPEDPQYLTVSIDGTLGQEWDVLVGEIIQNYRRKTDKVRERIMKTWEENLDEAIYATYYPERREFVPIPNEMFALLASPKKSAVMSLFIGINPGRVDEIFESILELAFYHTGLQHWMRIKELSEVEASTPELYRRLRSVRDERWIINPFIMTFEAAVEIRLRTEQVDDVLKLTNLVCLDGSPIPIHPVLCGMPMYKYPEIIVQRLMAYGKTLVLGTLLCLAKGDGYHMSIIIPPNALLETNAKDMSARASRFFNQSSSVIRFYRENDLMKESELLLSIYFTIKRTIRERGFVIMSIETIQALQNRWIMLKNVLVRGLEDEERTKSLLANFDLCHRVLLLLKKRG